MTNDYLILKWGTLKSWNFSTEEGKALLKEYFDIGACASAMLQHDTPKQKEIVCKLIDIVPGDIYLELDGKYVSKEEAKVYVMEYGNDTIAEKLK